jgi:hypothetical protein
MTSKRNYTKLLRESLKEAAEIRSGTKATRATTREIGDNTDTKRSMPSPKDAS